MIRTPGVRVLPQVGPWIAFLMISAAAGCGDTQGPFDTRFGPGLGTPAYTTPAELIGAFAAALRERDLERYIALLEPEPATRSEAGFRWYPVPGDLADPLWLDGQEHWDIEEEIGMISHMFDPSFVSQWTDQSVDVITADLHIQSVESLAGGEIRVRTTAVVAVIGAYYDGWRDGWQTETLLEFVLARGEGENLTIRSVRERELFARKDLVPDFLTLSQIKAWYR